MLNSISISCIAILLYCFSLILLNSHSCFANSNETDCLALLAIKSQLHDPLRVTSSWNVSLDLCQWTGVTCGQRHRRVTGLDLGNQSIGGFLSPYVGNLSFLRVINLADNGFSGEIPNEVGHLLRLEILELSNNSFTGKIPTNLSRCSNLFDFRIGRNQLVGEIPTAIGYWLKLEVLGVGNNQLTGQFPPFIGNLSALQLIDFGGNRLGGRIPDSLGQLRSLNSLRISLNNFSGTFPPSICNISSLELINLLSNRFEGGLPLDIGLKFPNLFWLSVYQNNFVGSLPHSLSNASNLELLDLSDNHFTGQVKIDFNRLPNLRKFGVTKNNLGAGATNDLDFITLLTNCSKLESFGLEFNRFGGVLPHSIANLSSTTLGITMGDNQICGTITPDIKNLVNLNVIGVEGNQLTGTIPHSIGELGNLQGLGLAGNNFQGIIPESLGNLTQLSILWLKFNRLQGSVPASLGNCQNLMILSVSNNKLTGALPREIFQIKTLSVLLDISDNLLSGSISQEVGNLKNLIKLDISRNHFSHEIPVTLSACTSLEYLRMQGNSFSGSIPSSLISLKGIKVLDLSCNNFSDQIPTFLENLSFLEYLNLSYNDFEGEVPIKGIFSNKTGISLTGNGKLCGGLAELHLPACQSKGSRRSKTIILKVMIPMITLFFILLSCFVVAYTRRRKSKRKTCRRFSVKHQFPMISYAELSKATNEFSTSNMIGQGNFGIVYKGNLGENGMPVAVKVMNLTEKGATKSFVAECEALRNIRHRNLIKIITVCSGIDFKGGDFKALVYEYMQCGSLHDWLHSSNDQLQVSNLNLIQALNLVIDVASAIEYLHHYCQPPIVHGDLKPSNVLIDHDMVSHVSDFGLARFLSNHSPYAIPETPSSSIGIKGTVGYVAPEYGMGGDVSMTGDVYSFGIMLLEIFTRRRPTDNMFNDGLTLHEFAKMALPKKVMEIVDPSLLLEVRSSNSRSYGNGRDRIEDCLVAVVRIGITCSMESPYERMQMTDVVAKLCTVREIFIGSRI